MIQNTLGLLADVLKPDGAVQQSLKEVEDSLRPTGNIQQKLTALEDARVKPRGVVQQKLVSLEDIFKSDGAVQQKLCSLVGTLSDENKVIREKLTKLQDPIHSVSSKIDIIETTIRTIRTRNQSAETPDSTSPAIQCVDIPDSSSASPTPGVVASGVSSNSTIPCPSTPHSSSTSGAEPTPDQSGDEPDAQVDDNPEEQSNNRTKRPIGVDRYHDPVQSPMGDDSTPNSSSKRRRLNDIADVTWQKSDIDYGVSSNANKINDGKMLEASGLPPYFIKLILHLDYESLDHRKSNQIANQRGGKQCWVATNDPLAKKNPQNAETEDAGGDTGDAEGNIVQSEPRSEDGPCGHCRARFEAGEDIVCFYFVTRRVICMFK